jgi:hypothetical protein
MALALALTREDRHTVRDYIRDMPEEDARVFWKAAMVLAMHMLPSRNW